MSSDAKTNLTDEGKVIVAISNALFADKVDEAFSILGDFMDENGLQVSAETIESYYKAGRVSY
jgi:hypothetical protein